MAEDCDEIFIAKNKREFRSFGMLKRANSETKKKKSNAIATIC